MYSSFCSTTFCHFSGNLIILSCQNIFFLKQRTILGAFYSFSQNWNFFPLKEFCKDWNKWTSESAMSDEYGEWIRTSQPSCNSFAWSSKKHVVLNYPDERFCSLCWLIPDAFHWVMLQLVSLVAVLVGINCFLFQEELTIDDSLPNPPYMQHHLLWMKISFWCGWCWFISLVPSSFLFHIIVQYPLFIPCQNLF